MFSLAAIMEEIACTLELYDRRMYFYFNFGVNGESGNFSSPNCKML